MKVSLNLAQEFSNVDLKGVPREELLRRIGAQLGAVEEVIDWAPKFEGAVIVKVVECAKHENADKLSVCLVDDGGKVAGVDRNTNGFVQVVCGAPNVHKDMFAVWLPPGTTVPNSRETEPFVLSSRDIRGVLSNGMMASAHELGISEDHSGIVEITPEDAGREPSQGDALVDYFGLDDFVVDCENKMFTHRPDCFGNLGVARELAGILGEKFEDPEWYWKKPDFVSAQVLDFSVSNVSITPRVSQLVPRFMAVSMKDVHVRPSPMWLQATLARVGIKPINNVVDVTNFVMHLTGQPLHAFDYDKVKEISNSTSIFPRLSQKGEKLILLGQKEIELTGEEIVISTDRQAIALAGVMGGAETEVDENTKNIIIECATFDMYSIRRTSMRFGLFTDAVTRFNKGQSPLQNDRVLAYAMKKMAELAGAEQASDVFDIRGQIQQAYLDQSMSGTLEVKRDFINDRLGSNLDNEQICGLLQNVHFAAYVNDDDSLEITAPFWRMDIELNEDIVEEVGRLYGFDKLPVILPVRTSRATPNNRLFNYKLRLRSLLKEAGANEVLSYSFVHGDLLSKTGASPDKHAYHLRNALSPRLQYYRTALMPSLLDKVHMNLKSDMVRGDDNEFAMFEIGKVHIKGHERDGLPEEFERLGFVVAADDKTVARKYEGAPYYQATTYLQWVLGFEPQLKPLETNDLPLTSCFSPGRAALVMHDEELLGVVGEYTAATRSALKLPQFTAGFELDIMKLLAISEENSLYTQLSNYPKTVADVTLEVPQTVSFGALRTAVVSAFDSASTQGGYRYTIKPRDIFAQEGSDRKRITFRIWLSHPEKTLTTVVVNELLDKVIASTAELDARRI